MSSDVAAGVVLVLLALAGGVLALLVGGLIIYASLRLLRLVGEPSLDELVKDHELRCGACGRMWQTYDDMADSDPCWQPQ